MAKINFAIINKVTVQTWSESKNKKVIKNKIRPPEETSTRMDGLKNLMRSLKVETKPVCSLLL
jgi:hypothetical protein